MRKAGKRGPPNRAPPVFPFLEGCWSRGNVDWRSGRPGEDAGKAESIPPGRTGRKVGLNEVETDLSSRRRLTGYLYGRFRGGLDRLREGER